MTLLNKNSFILAVTGGLACGKSEVGRILQQHGFAVCDADHLAHDLTKKNTPIYQAILNTFGQKILTNNKEISRPTLGKIVFKNPHQLQKLNDIIHPEIRKILIKKIKTFRTNAQPAALLVPLLFEAHMDNLDWDTILCVSANKEIIFDRLAKRGLNKNESLARLAAQLPLTQKESRSNIVLHNSGTLNDLEKNLLAIVNKIQNQK